MSVIETEIQATLAALVSGRCYPLIAPANTLKPYITYQIISNIPTVDMDGPTGTENRRLQVDAWAATYAGVKDLEDSIKAAMTAALFTNVPLSCGDLWEPDTQLFRSLQEYSIWS